MNIETDCSHKVLRLTRAEAEEVYAAILEEMVVNSEENPLQHWAMEGVAGARELASDSLAWRILAYRRILGHPSLVAQFDAFGISIEDIEGVVVEAPTDIETIAKIEGRIASDSVIDAVMKRGV